MTYANSIRQLPHASPHAVGDIVYHGSESGWPIEEPEDREFFVSMDPTAAGFFALDPDHRGRRVVSVYRVIAVPRLAVFTSHGSQDLGPELASLDMLALRTALRTPTLTPRSMGGMRSRLSAAPRRCSTGPGAS